MNVASAAKVRSIIEATDTVEWQRSKNRSRIQESINGFPPLAVPEAKKMGLRININWLEHMVLNRRAVLQWIKAFQSQDIFFNVRIPSLPEDKRTDWELQITQFINRPLKKSREYASLLDNEAASVTAYGISPEIWLSKDGWLPEFVSLKEIRVPTDTETSLKNLTWFAIRRRYTIGELVKAVFGKNADKGWDKPQIQKILAHYWNQNYESNIYADNWGTQPERMADIVKQNMMYYASDAVPTIPLWHFYHIEDSETDNTSKVYLKVVSDRSVQGCDAAQFLYQSDKPKAQSMDELLHVQFADLNSDPPFKWHSVRSLGFMLYEPCFWSNLTMCRGLQHLWENFNMILQGGNPTDKGRSQVVELFDKGWLPSDVRVLKQDERQQINEPLLNNFMSRMKQLQGEAGAGYVQEADTGTQKERTAFETMTIQQSVNTVMTGILLVGFRNKSYQYQEICRRFCNKKSTDKDVRKFQQQWRRLGIPSVFLDSDLWDIEPEVPLGSGNQTMEVAEAQALMSVRDAMPPQAQQIILHMFVAAVSKNAKLAQRLIPVNANMTPSQGAMYAASIFGTLMQGVPVKGGENIVPIDQIETLLGMAAGVIQRIEQADNMGTQAEVAGLDNTLTYVGGLVDTLGQDPQQKQRVTQYTKELTMLGNQVKAFNQRIQQQGSVKDIESISYKDAPPDIQRQMEQKFGYKPSKDPSSQIDPQVAKVNQQLDAKDAKHVQSIRQNAEKFHQELQHEDIRTSAEVQKQGLLAGIEAAHKAHAPEAPAGEKNGQETPA